MPIRILTLMLALSVMASFLADPGSLATSGSDARAIETRDVVTMRKMRYRVVTTGSAVSSTAPAKPKDVFRLTILGVQIQDQDRLSFTIEGADGRVDLGSPTFLNSDFIVLRRRRGNGSLNSDPYLFPKVRLRFNPQRGRLNFFSGKGVAQATPVLSTVGVTSGNPITVTMHVQRPGDGDFDFVFAGMFRIRHSVKGRSQVHVYRANGQ